MIITVLKKLLTVNNLIRILIVVSAETIGDYFYFAAKGIYTHIAFFLPNEHSSLGFTSSALIALLGSAIIYEEFEKKNLKVKIVYVMSILILCSIISYLMGKVA